MRGGASRLRAARERRRALKLGSAAGMQSDTQPDRFRCETRRLENGLQVHCLKETKTHHSNPQRSCFYCDIVLTLVRLILT